MSTNNVIQTDEVQSQSPWWQRIVNKLIDNGQLTIVVLVMGFVIWVLFSWVDENNRQVIKRMEKLETMVDDCNQAKKDRIESKIDNVDAKLTQVDYIIREMIINNRENRP